MKKFKLMGLLVAILLAFPATVLAGEGGAVSTTPVFDEEELEVIDQNTIYLKTVTYYDNSVYDLSSQNVLNSIYNAKSVTTEISEEEYNNADLKHTFEVNASTSIETTYKSMTTYLSKNGDYFRYKNIVYWKNYPAVRDYDVIAIGFLGTVEPVNLSFKLENCTSEQCFSSGFSTPQVFSNGASATYILPGATDLKLLRSTFYFDVKKVDSSRTIITQAAYGDYAHAIKKTGLLQSLEHEVIQGAGIDFDDKVVDNFDTMPVADVYWDGTW